MIDNQLLSATDLRGLSGDIVQCPVVLEARIRNVSTQPMGEFPQLCFGWEVLEYSMNRAVFESSCLERIPVRVTLRDGMVAALDVQVVNKYDARAWLNCGR